MKVIRVVLLIPVIVLASLTARADDLTGSSTFLCAAVQATQCFDGGDCEIDLPWNINVPQFVEIDLDAKVIRTTAASGQNRMTPIEHLEAEEGMIALQGFELGKGFTFVIDEKTGRATIAIATRGQAIIVFGVCTPMAPADASAQ
jgi:hypothetical protein